MISNEFFDSVHHTLRQVENTQMDAIHRAAVLTANSLARDGMIQVFGTGHSHMMAEEVFFRAGGLVQVNAILDPSLMLNLSALGSTQIERLEGYSRLVLERYNLQAGDVMVVVSNSGRNAGPIEAALYAREKGLPVIALTSAASYQGSQIRHSSGKHLCELADVVIDTCVPHGDATLTLAGIPERIGPVSTIIGASIMQAYIVDTIAEMVRQGCRPKVIVSANVESSQDQAALFEDYHNRIKHW
jgi:uncharacterized phosphosugar-binding protein